MQDKEQNYLVLVNGEHRLPEDYAETIEFISGENGVGRHFQVEKKAYEAFLRLQEDLLKNEKADLAVICSPTGFHAQQSIAFLEHGIHVFCDKPAASSLAETCAMFEAAEKNNRKLMIYQPRRLFPNSHAIRQIFASGKLGKIYQMKLAVNSYSRRNDWQAFRKYGGGMLRNYGAHYVDQLISILKEDFEILMCESSCVATVGDADDVFKLVMKGKSSSILVDIDVNQAAGVYPYVWILYGEHGIFIILLTLSFASITRERAKSSSKHSIHSLRRLNSFGFCFSKLEIGPSLLHRESFTLTTHLKIVANDLRGGSTLT